MTIQFLHHPVLLHESLEQLRLQPGSTVIDGTLGGAGHAISILDRTSPDGRLIGLDLDADALAAARSRLESLSERTQLIQASFRNLDHVVADLGLNEVDGVLFDLGVSSYQLDNPDRGFRFADAKMAPAPLDMRMDSSGGPTAAELLRRASSEELQRIFQNYGELPGARRLARAIAERRRKSPLETTADLLELIRETGIGRGRRHNPATLVFQALRIAVNDELDALREGLEAAISVLRPGGRLVVIAYHSLEDRLVKQTFRSAAQGCICPKVQPICTCNQTPRLKLILRRPLRPQAAETELNPRSRSALLRSAERIREAA